MSITYRSILATDDNGNIGYKNSLPWPKNKEDFSIFKDITMDNVVLMGYNTWKSLPGPLKRRHILVVSRTPIDGVDTIIQNNDSLFDLDHQIKSFCRIKRHEMVIVMGGKKIYELFLPLTSVVYHSRIKGVYPADTSMNMTSYLKDFTVRSKMDNFDTIEFNIYSRNRNYIN